MGSSQSLAGLLSFDPRGRQVGFWLACGFGRWRQRDGLVRVLTGALILGWLPGAKRVGLL
jgi:hypothetical protein